MEKPKPIAFYYGAGELEKLIQYERVVLQGPFYSASEVAWLEAQGTFPMAYLSLSEDTEGPAEWQRDRRNPDWGGAYVQVGHPGWVGHVLAQAHGYLNKGFRGLFLDTLDISDVFPEDTQHMFGLLAKLREKTRPAYLMANRGFTLMPRLAELVDAHLFESFSVAWTPDGSYATWPQPTLEINAQRAEALLETSMELFALDYADTPELRAFAEARAHAFGMKHFISDKALSKV